MGDIYINDEIWRSHYLCFLASGVILCFEVMNQPLLLFLSASRLMVVVFPLNSRLKDANFTRACLSVFVWTFYFHVMLFNYSLPNSVYLFTYSILSSIQ